MLGFRVWDYRVLGFRVWDYRVLGFRVWDLGYLSNIRADGMTSLHKSQGFRAHGDPG